MVACRRSSLTASAPFSSLLLNKSLRPQENISEPTWSPPPWLIGWG